ncbi:hypothetical protein PILCRDRAFT_825271, partial [Piloderma croceum F 1598]
MSNILVSSHAGSSSTSTALSELTLYPFTNWQTVSTFTLSDCVFANKLQGPSLNVNRRPTTHRTSFVSSIATYNKSHLANV